MLVFYRKFLEEIYYKSLVRNFVMDNSFLDLREVYNNCIDKIFLMWINYLKMIFKYIFNLGEENNIGYGIGGIFYGIYLGIFRNLIEFAVINNKNIDKI